MTSNFVPVSQLDVPTLKESLKKFLAGQTRFADYDFEGSNLSALLDLLSASGFQHTFFTNMVGNEMFNDTAILRDSVISHAKELNYVPQSRVAATALVRITIAAPDNPAAVFIPKYYPLTTNYNGRAFKFTTNESITVYNRGGVLQTDPIAIYEGDIVEEWFEIESLDQRLFTLESDAIDISSIDVEIVNSSTDSTTTPWSRASNLYGVDNTSKVYFVQAGQQNQYQLQFGNGVVGASPQVGNLIHVTYRITSPNESYGARIFAAGQVISGYSAVTVQTIQPSSSGAEREDTESIRYNAPRHFAAQRRAIGDDDYRTLIKEQFPQIQSITTYGGQDAVEKQYGKVFIVTKPFDSDVTSDTIKKAILAYIKPLVGTTSIPVLIDPVYLYLTIDSTVYYESSQTNAQPSDIETAVLKAIVNYNNTNLADFGNDFRHSRFETVIDNADKAIVSNETVVRITTKLSPISDNPTTYSIQIDNALQPGKIFSGNFQQQVDQTVYQAWIADDGNGNLNIYTKSSNVVSVLISNIGTVNYTTGILLIKNLTVYDYVGSSIPLYCSSVSRDIIANRDKIIEINPTDVNIVVKQAQY